MAYVDVSSWSAEHVVSWIRGLHDSMVALPLDQLVRTRLNGNRLMLITAQDLIDLIPSIRVEALQAVIGGIDLLRYLSCNSSTETLQSLTLNLACVARYLYNQLIQAEHSPRLLPVSTTVATPMTGNSKNRFDFAKVDSNVQINQSTKQRVSLETLDSVSIIVDRILYVVKWLDSIGSTTKFNKDFRSIVLRVAVELTSTAQRDQFVEQPNDVIKKTSKFLADYCEWVVLAIDDPDFIQPCWLDIVSVKKKLEENDYGIVIQPATIGSLAIEKVVFSSPAHRSGRISEGDEIIQIDYQTVVGWCLERVRDLIQTYRNEIILTIKKKPTQSSLNPSIIVIKPYAIPLKRILSHNSESDQDPEFAESTEPQQFFGRSQDDVPRNDSLKELPKEPKGPVYELQPTKSRRELKRRMSISGSISDALVDLSLADSLPIPSLNKLPSSSSDAPDKSKLNRITRETLTKSVSHDTAKLYLHTLSIDRKHLWLPQTSRRD